VSDLGIRREDLLMALAGVAAIFVIGLGLYAALGRIGRRLPRWTDVAAGASLAVVGVGALGFFGVEQRAISDDRHDFLSTLPASRWLLPGSTQRPHLAVEPRLGSGGYPDPRDPATPIPTLGHKRNVLLILADGFRADHVGKPLALTPKLTAFAERPEVIVPRRHYSTGPFTEMGLYGLAYGLNTFTYFPFIERRIPSYPLEVFRRNGYVVALITGSRVLQFPSSQLLDDFDPLVALDGDALVFEAVSDFLRARREDGKPYFLVAFYYAPHWPFDSVEEPNRRFRPDLMDGGRSAFDSPEDPLFRKRVRNSYLNSVIQFDDLFSRTLDLVRDDYEAGRTAVAFTSDHGTELWEHGIMGQGRSTFWNEKVAVPFFLGLPGALLTPALKSPEFGSHVDLFPTLFQYLHASPAMPAESYSHGRSLLEPSGAPEERVVMLTGRYFPWADRQNTLVTAEGKFWFHVARADGAEDFVTLPGRATDLDDAPLAPGSWTFPEEPARRFRAQFWRFLRPTR